MKLNIKSMRLLFSFLLFGVAFQNGIAGNTGSQKETGKKLSKNSAFLSSHNLEVNNITMYFQSNGDIQDPTLQRALEYPRGSKKYAIFAAGFGLSGYIDGDLSTSWMASASRIEDWQPGPIINGAPADPNDKKYRAYKYTKGDTRAQNADIDDWPVFLGAPFDDRNGNGVYDPQLGDLPALPGGDQMVFYVMNDGITPSVRQLTGSKPMGVEAQVTAFAFRQSNDLGNVVYVIYKFINKGSKPIENAIFSVWSDPDLGDAADDLVGVDSARSLAYCWNDKSSDATYGSAPPASGYDFFLGPKVFTGNTSDTLNILGRKLVGYKQLAMNSFVKYVNGRADLPDPHTIEEARYYQEGFRFDGRPFDPVTEGIGGLSTDNPRIVHPGYPESNSGWRDSNGDDRRMMINTKPFTIEEGDTQVIVVGYMVGQGADNTKSVAKLRQVDDFAQTVFDANFQVAGPPPAPGPISHRIDTDGKINFNFPTAKSFNDVQKDSLGNKKVFKGYRVYQYRSGEFSETVDGVLNKKLILQIDKTDGYASIYKTYPDGVSGALVYEEKSKFNNDEDYSKKDGVFNFTLERDAFTNNSFIEGETYYFGFASFNVEVNKIKPVYNADSSLIIAWKHGDEPISVSGENTYSLVYKNSLATPFYIAADKSSKFVKKDAGKGEGNVYVDVLEPDSVKDGETYKIKFYYSHKDSISWRVLNTAGDTLLDKRTYYSAAMTNPVVDGLSIRVSSPAYKIVSADYAEISNPTPTPWVGTYIYRTLTGTALLNKGSIANDGGFLSVIPGSTPVAYNHFFSSVYNDGVRDIKLEFTKQNPSKAYRYINGVNQVSPSFTPPVYQPKSLVKGAADSMVWAGFTKGSANAPNTGRLQNARKPGVGIVDLPIRAWDMSYAGPNVPPRQLKIALVENYGTGDAAKYINALNGRFGQDTLVAEAREVILVSLDDYDPNLKMPSDTTQLDQYMTYLFRNGKIVGNYFLAWESTADTTKFVEGSTLTFRTNAYDTTDQYTLSGFTSAENYYEANKKAAFDKLTIFPNPYMGDNPQEVVASERFVTMLNVPKRATIRVYNLAGELVRKLEKDDNNAMVRWDLKNSTGLLVASGVYLIHIDAPGVGSKVLKFALVQRQEQITTY